MTTSLTVTGSYGSATTISAVPEAIPGVYDLTATIFGYSPLTVAGPTGTADFLNASNAGAQLASVPLSSGTASQSLGFLSFAKPSVPGLMAAATTVGDFNGDGNPDIAVSDSTNNVVQVFVGNGDGTFKTGASYAVGMGAYSLDSSDLNNDGKLDLIVVNEQDSTVSVLLGNGDGTFQAQSTYAIGTSSESYGPSQVAVGDFNGDGNLDLVVVVASGVSILFGNGDGTFQPEMTYPIEAPDYYDLGDLGALAPVDPLSVAIGDFNGDGKLDLATANGGIYDESTYDDNVSVLLGNGDGTFQPAQFYTIGDQSTSVAAGDFNGDGKLDLAVTVGTSNVIFEEYSAIWVLIGIGDGTFQSSATYRLPDESFPGSIHVSDFNGDHNADLAVTSVLGAYTAGTQDLVFVVLGNGDGTFQPEQGYLPASTATGSSIDLGVGDFNGDGKPDLVALEQTYPAVSIPPAVSLNTGPSVTVTATGVAVPGGSSQLIEASYSGDSLYNASVSSPVTLSGIAPAPLTWANPAPITYGTGLGAAQLDATSTVEGTFVYTPAAGAVLGAGSQSLSVTFTPTNATDYASATQTVMLTVNLAPLSATANNAARVYGADNPVFTGSVTGIVNGDALVETFTTTATATSIVGNYLIVPAITGAAAANYTVTASNGTLTVSQAGTTTSLALSNQNMALTATVVSVTTGQPTGSVSFYNGPTMIGSAPITGGAANYTLTEVPAASASITAEYSGDANFTASSSPASSILSVAPASTSLTVGPTGSVSDNLTVTPVAGYTGALQFSCSGLPQHSTCSFQPSSISFSGTNSATKVVLTIQTGTSGAAASASQSPSFPDNSPFIPAIVLGIPGWWAWVAGAARRNRKCLRGNLMLLALWFGSVGWIVSCGGGGQMQQGTTSPAGTSTVQITAVGTSNVTLSTPISLTVQ